MAARIPMKLSDSGGPTAGIDSGGSGGMNTAAAQSLSRSSSTGGSFRKVLPSVPDMDQQLNMATKMIDRRTSTKKGNHSYTPYFLEYTLLAEYNLLQKQTVSGVYVIPSANSPLVWLGVIFVRQGTYQEGIFRFSLHIPENYPDGEVPNVIFETAVFHPMVDPETGELEVKKGFAHKWRRNVNHLWHVLLYVRRIFYKIETASPLNPEAAVLYDSEPSVFELKVRQCVRASKDETMAPPKTNDPHAIVFSEFDPKLHEPVLAQLKSKDREYVKSEGASLGTSWVEPGSLNIFSKPVS